MKTSASFLPIFASLAALAAAQPRHLLPSSVILTTGVAILASAPTTVAGGSSSTPSTTASSTQTGISATPTKYQASCENLENAATEGVDSNSVYSAVESFCSAIDGRTVKPGAPQTTQVALSNGKSAELSASLSSGSQYLIKSLDCNVQLGGVVLIQCAQDDKTVSGSIMASNSTYNGNAVALYSVNIN